MNFHNIIAGQGISLMIVGMTVVFCALVILMFMMKGLKSSLKWLHNRQLMKNEGAGASSGDKLDSDEIPGVVIAAIALTLILEEEASHDEESLVLTLQSLPKPYSNWWMSGLTSPWQSKYSKFRQSKSEQPCE